MEAQENMHAKKSNANADLCSWLTAPQVGRVIVEGRASLPDGYPLPSRAHGIKLTWRRAGEFMAFRGRRMTDCISLGHVEELDWFDHHPVRIDRVVYRAPSSPMPGEMVMGAEVVFDAQDRPKALVYTDRLTTEAELADVSAGAVRAFGNTVAVGAWARDSEGRRMAQLEPIGAAAAVSSQVQARHSPSDRLSLSRWLLDNERGMATFEGRARLPDGAVPPTDFPAWLSVTWESLGDGVWRYRGTHKATRSPMAYEREGDEPEAGVDKVHDALDQIGCRVYRCDRYAFETADEPLDHDRVLTTGLWSWEVVAGVPVALLYDAGDPNDPEEAEIARDLKVTFGDALEIGPWSRAGEGWRAPVIRWDP